MIGRVGWVGRERWGVSFSGEKFLKLKNKEIDNRKE